MPNLTNNKGDEQSIIVNGLELIIYNRYVLDIRTIPRGNTQHRMNACSLIDGWILENPVR